MVNASVLKKTFELLTQSKLQYCVKSCFRNETRTLNKIHYQSYQQNRHLANTSPNYCQHGKLGILLNVIALNCQ